MIYLRRAVCGLRHEAPCTMHPAFAKASAGNACNMQHATPNLQQTYKIPDFYPSCPILLKKVRMSSASNSGFSTAGKCPPEGKSDQC
jgi:hypothetical protein